jgi:hypothetical protein
VQWSSERTRPSPLSGQIDDGQGEDLMRRCPSGIAAARRVKERGPWTSCPRGQQPLFRLFLDEHTEPVASFPPAHTVTAFTLRETREVPEKFLLRIVLRAWHWFHSIVVLHPYDLSRGERASAR